MKITIYTVPTCQFSKQEKDYLHSKSLAFEEKNLEGNREWLTEMLAVSNNFAGTPVTKIEKDDGKIAVLKGFTKEDFDRELVVETPKVEVKMDVPTSTPVVPNPPTPVEPTMPKTPVSEPTPTPIQPVTPPPEESTNTPMSEPQTPPPAPTQTNEALASILADLQKKAEVTTQSAITPPSTTATQTTPPSMPNIPDFPQSSNS